MSCFVCKISFATYGLHLIIGSTFSIKNGDGLRSQVRGDEEIHSVPGEHDR